jgi:hypothetical protein
VVVDFIGFHFVLYHNILISCVRSMAAKRQRVLDLFHARAWPAAFKGAVSRPDSQRKRQIHPKQELNSSVTSCDKASRRERIY